MASVVRFAEIHLKEMKWDGIPKAPRDWTVCAQRVLAGELCAVFLLCDFCCVPKLGKGCGKAVRRSSYLCGIKCHAQTGGVGVKLQGCNLCCLSCVAEDAVCGDWAPKQQSNKTFPPSSNISQPLQMSTAIYLCAYLQLSSCWWFSHCSFSNEARCWELSASTGQSKQCSKMKK